MTQRLYEAGQLLGIDLLDHLVIGDNKWVSLKQIGAFYPDRHCHNLMRAIVAEEGIFLLWNGV